MTALSEQPKILTSLSGHELIELYGRCFERTRRRGCADGIAARRTGRFTIRCSICVFFCVPPLSLQRLQLLRRRRPPNLKHVLEGRYARRVHAQQCGGAQRTASYLYTIRQGATRVPRQPRATLVSVHRQTSPYS
jgi:hypothetical protein